MFWEPFLICFCKLRILIKEAMSHLLVCGAYLSNVLAIRSSFYCTTNDHNIIVIWLLFDYNFTVCGMQPMQFLRVWSEKREYESFYYLLKAIKSWNVDFLTFFKIHQHFRCCIVFFISLLCVSAWKVQSCWTCTLDKVKRMLDWVISDWHAMMIFISW